MTDRLLVRGRIATFDSARPEATSVLIDRGVVAELDASGDLDAAVIELPGDEWLQPGYVDDHVHVLATAATRLSVDVSAASSIADLLAVVEEACRHIDGWLRVWGYDDALLVDRRHPSLDELDEVTADRPTVVHHRSGHVALVNSAALRALGDGPPGGVVVEGHELLAKVPRLDPVQLAESAAAVLDEMVSRGIVRCTEATHTNDLAALEFLATLTRRDGPDIVAMVGADRLGSLGGLDCGDAVHGVQIGHAKVMPVIGDDHSLVPLVAAARAADFPVALHVMDIDTLAVTLDALGESPSGADRIEHCALALPEQLDRVAADGHAVCTQPSFVSQREAKYRAQLSNVEQTWLWPLRSLVERGITVTFGSDSPVVPADPSQWIDGAVDRPIGADEAVDRDTALRLASIGPVAPGLAARGLVIGGGRGFRRLGV